MFKLDKIKLYMETKHCNTCKTDKDSTAFMIGDKCYKQCGECIKKRWCSHNIRKSTCKECGGSSFCSHNKRKATCKECGGSEICSHNRIKSVCKECGGSSICIHNRTKSSCKECGGSEICSHNKRKSRCKECGGSQICSHNRMKSRCKDCGGSSICIHNRMKSMCKECGGSSICIHNRMKSMCKECGGSCICIHNKQKSMCKECGGSSICIHNKQKSTCKECGGSCICIHNKQKSMCKECGGSSICIHNKQKSTCYECNPTSNLFCISSHCSMITNNKKKYDGYCTHCFKNMFPDDPRTLDIRTKSKELLVKQYLSENHTGFIHDIVLETKHCDCSHRRRIDFRMLINNTLLCVEVDENQHSSYMTDEIRYNDLYMTFSGKFIFIRFNPDNYRIDGILKKTQIKTRLKSLSDEINKHITRIQNEDNSELLEIHKLYYNI